MRTSANLMILIVAALHLGFLILEMFLWNHPVGHKVFSMTPAEAESSAVLAMNQGLYNGFLAAGLLWGLITDKVDFKFFFLICVLVAGIFGGITAKPSIFFIQAAPAGLAMALLAASRRAIKETSQ